LDSLAKRATSSGENWPRFFQIFSLGVLIWGQS
jgi:hypothetical protein